MSAIRKTALAITTVMLLGSVTFLPRAVSADRSSLEVLLDNRKVVNVVDDFLWFWEKARGKSPRTQRRLWFRMVENKHRDYFERAVYRNAASDQRRLMLDLFLARVPDHVDAIREFNRVAGDRLTEAIIDFKSRFPEYRHRKNVYIGLSLFGFDGAVRPVRNDGGVPDTLCLAADVLCDYSGDELRIAMAHEFFHLYHFSFLFEQPAIAEFRGAHLPLMSEGMAVAGAEAVYPYQARELYLHVPDEELADQRAQLATSSARFLELIQSGAAAEDYELWFKNTGDDFVPDRGGYLLGYEAAKRVLSVYTLEQMVRMTPSQLREQAEEQLTVMSGARFIMLASAR
ncbi:MAG TPA: hypothetical protein VJH03_10040 [Blastocatellia bacterium]|nr:hypothetical protein [Blastocatellia bacterium]